MLFVIVLFQLGVLCTPSVDMVIFTGGNLGGCPEAL